MWRSFQVLRGEDNGFPGGDSQRAHQKVFVGQEVRQELEGVRKKVASMLVVVFVTRFLSTSGPGLVEQLWAVVLRFSSGFSVVTVPPCVGVDAYSSLT